ncbi:MAG TPA: PH domain-containing protein [Actinomycetota bacterium]|nr:PH domain-containing protein [Actinomycetota bacterium]
MRSEDLAVAPGGGGPRRLHVLSPVFFAAGHVRRLWPLALLVLARRQLWLIVAAVVGLLAVTTLEWLRRTYVLEAAALRVEEGVLARKLRVVPFDRIQQVDLVRKPLHRVLGVATLRVETAGGGRAAEVDLDVVSLGEAQALRSSLLRAKAGAAEAGGEEAEAVGGRAPPERALLRLSVGQVMLAGITGTRAAAVLAVLGPLSQLSDWSPSLSDWLLRRFNPEAVAPTTPAAVVAVAVLAAAVWLGLAAASSVVTDFGFTLARVGGDLVVRRGLLERREAVLPIARLQVVRVEESLLRRALGLASIRIQSAGRAGGADQTASRLAIPILPRSEVNRVLGELLPGAAPIPRLLAPPPVARRRAVRRSLVGAAPPIVAAAVVLWALSRPTAPAALLGVPLAVLGGLAAYRSLGHARRDGFLYARRGVPIRVTTVVPVAKAQSGSVRSSLFQRRVGLATLHVDVAGGGPTPRVLDEAEGKAEELLQVVLGRSPRPGFSGG